MPTTITREVQPYDVPVTFGTRPNGLRYTMDGRTLTRPLGQRFIAGASVRLATPSRQYLDGRLWQLRSWPGSRPATHTLVVPRRDSYAHRAVFVPVERRLQVLTQPAGLAVNVLGARRRHGFTTQVQVGRRVPVTAPRTQVHRGWRYRFVRWSDRGAVSHGFRMPEGDTYRRAVYVRAGRA